MTSVEEVGLRLSLLGRGEYLAGLAEARKALGDLGGSSKAAGDSGKAMGTQTEEQRAAVARLKDTTIQAITAQRDYEKALRDQAVAAKEAAASDDAAAQTRKKAAADQVATSKATRDASLAAQAEAKNAVKVEEDVAERTRLAGVKKVSTWQSFKQNVLGSTSAVKTASTGVATTEAENAVKIEAANARKAASWGKAANASKGIAVAVAVTAVAVGATTLKMASDFQADMEKLVTMAHVPQSSLKGLSDSVLSLAGQVGTDPNSLAEAMYHIQSSFAGMGLSAQKSTDILRIAAEGAKIGGANLVDVTNAMDAAIVSGIPGAQDYNHAMGDLIATVGAGDMQMQDLAQAMGGGMLDTVKGYGVTMRDVSAVLADFGDNNLRGAAAGTQLRMAVQALGSPAKAGLGQLQALGIGTKQLALDMQSGGINKAVTDLHDHLDKAGITGVKVGATLTDIFGKKAGTGIAAMINDYDRLQGKFGEVDKGANDFAASWAGRAQTFQQRTDDMSAAAKATGIKIGTALLPIASAVLDAFTHAFSGVGASIDWLGNHKGVLIGLGAAIFTALIPALVGLAVAIWSTTVALLASPLTWAAIAVGLLVFAVYELYTHWSTVWGFIKMRLSEFADHVMMIVHAVGGIFSWFYSSVLTPMGHFFATTFGAVEDALTGVGHFFQTVFSAIGAAAMGFWHFLETVGNGVITVLKWVGAIIFTILVAPFVLAFNLLKDPVLSFWHGVIEPAFHGIATLFQWLFSSAIKPTGDAIGSAIRAVGGFFSWLWTTIVIAVVTGIHIAWQWLYSTVIKPVGDAIGASLNWLGSIFTWLWQNVVMRIVRGIQMEWNWLYTNVIVPIGQGIMASLQFLGSIFTWLWQTVVMGAVHGIEKLWHWLHDNVIKPVGDAINVVVHSIGQTFSDIVDWIKRTWQTVMDIVSIPVRFIVNIVYSKGIKPTWDSIAGVFGLPPAPVAPMFSRGGIAGEGTSGNPVHAASGRVMPGYAPGVDSIHAMVSPGEAVMVPEWTRAMQRMHGPNAIAAMNAAAMGGRGGAASPGRFATGGIGPQTVPDLPIPPMPAEGPNVSIGGAILKSLGNLFSLPKLVTDPKGYFSDLFKPFTDPLAGMGHSQFITGMEAVPGKAIDGLVQKVEGFFSSLFGGGGGGPAGPGGPAPAGMINDWILQALGLLGYPTSFAAGLYQQIMLESSGNPNAIQGNIGDVNNASGDLAKGIMQVISTTFAANALPGHGNIFNPVDNIAAGSHYAMNKYGAGWFSPGPQHSHGYGRGGVAGYPTGIIASARALGGPINSGLPYMVGEAGPEIVVPSSSGTVIPADLSAAMFESVGNGSGGGYGRSGDVIFQPGSIVVQAAADPMATANMVSQVIADRMARQ